MCIAVCVFCVQCSVCWVPICSAPPTASTHRAGSVWQEGADLNTMPPGYPPPTPPVQTGPDQDLNALLTPTPSTMVSYSCLGCLNALLRTAQNAKLKEYIVIIKGVANSDFPNFTGVSTKNIVFQVVLRVVCICYSCCFIYLWKHFMWVYQQALRNSHLSPRLPEESEIEAEW